MGRANRDALRRDLERVAFVTEAGEGGIESKADRVVGVLRFRDFERVAGGRGQPSREHRRGCAIFGVGHDARV